MPDPSPTYPATGEPFAFPTTPEGWAKLNWDELGATIESRLGIRTAYLAELRRQITAASTDSELAARLALSCAVTDDTGGLMFRLEALAHSQLHLSRSIAGFANNFVPGR